MASKLCSQTTTRITPRQLCGTGYHGSEAINLTVSHPTPTMIHVGLEIALSDTQVDASQTASQRQAAISVFPLGSSSASAAPLNLCLVLDRSGSMEGKPLDTIKKAAKALIEQLSNSDILTQIYSLTRQITPLIDR